MASGPVGCSYQLWVAGYSKPEKIVVESVRNSLASLLQAFPQSPHGQDVSSLSQIVVAEGDKSCDVSIMIPDADMIPLLLLHYRTVLSFTAVGAPSRDPWNDYEFGERVLKMLVGSEHAAVKPESGAISYGREVMPVLKAAVATA